METVELRDFVKPLLRWWWLLLISTVIAAITTYIYASSQPAIYRSSSTIMVGTALTELNPSSPELSMGNQLAYVYVDIARRTPIRNATKEALGMDWLPSYSVRQVPNTQLIEISVEDVDPMRAQMVAEELVNQLILQTPGSAEDQGGNSFLEQQLLQLENSITQTEDALDEQKQALTGMFSARQIADAREQIAALETKLATLQGNYASLLSNSTTGAANRITVIDPPQVPTRPVDQNVPLTVAIAAALGFSIAAAGAYLLGYLDDTFRTEDDAQRYLHLPTLGTLPHIKTKGKDSEPVLTAASSPSPAKDAYGGLRLTLFSSVSEQDLGLLLVSSPGTGDGKSIVATNLAIELAESGLEVILVDADLHRPKLHRYFRLKNQAGLTNVLLRPNENVVHLLQDTANPRLAVLTSGPIPPYSAQLLGSKRMQHILDDLSDMADIVLLDAPPVTATVDASILGSIADGVLLVVSAGRTRRKLSQDAVRILRKINANILGVVLNDVDVKQGTYYSDYGIHIEPELRTRYAQAPETMLNISTSHRTDVKTAASSSN